MGISFRKIAFAGGQWRWGWQILFFLALVAIALAAVLELGSLTGVLSAEATGWSPTIKLTLVYLALYGAFLGASALAIRWLRGESLSDLGFSREGNWPSSLVIGMVLGSVVGIGSSVGLAWLFGWYHVKGFAWQVGPGDVVLMTLVVTTLGAAEAGLFEEVVFRGFLLRVISERWGLTAAVVATSLLFALFHVVNLVVNGPTAHYPAWLALASLTLAGLVFAQAYLTFRNLWAPVGLHFGWDLTIQLLGQQGQPAKGASLLVTTVSGSPIFQGPQGPGLGLFDLVGLGLVSLILLLLGRRRAPVERASGKSVTRL
jgi:membrane protease YdiL (CAAX protease family)